MATPKSDRLTRRRLVAALLALPHALGAARAHLAGLLAGAWGSRRARAARAGAIWLGHRWPRR